MRPALIQCNKNESSQQKQRISVQNINDGVQTNLSNRATSSTLAKSHSCIQLPQSLNPSEFLLTTGNTNEEDIDEPMTCGDAIDDTPVDLNTLDNINLDFPLNVRSDFEVDDNILTLHKDIKPNLSEQPIVNKEKIDTSCIKNKTIPESTTSSNKVTYEQDCTHEGSNENPIKGAYL